MRKEEIKVNWEDLCALSIALCNMIEEEKNQIKKGFVYMSTNPFYGVSRNWEGTYDSLCSIHRLGLEDGDVSKVSEWFELVDQATTKLFWGSQSGSTLTATWSEKDDWVLVYEHLDKNYKGGYLRLFEALEEKNKIKKIMTKFI